MTARQDPGADWNPTDDELRRIVEAPYGRGEHSPRPGSYARDLARLVLREREELRASEKWRRDTALERDYEVERRKQAEAARAAAVRSNEIFAEAWNETQAGIAAALDATSYAGYDIATAITCLQRDLIAAEVRLTAVAAFVGEDHDVDCLVYGGEEGEACDCWTGRVRAAFALPAAPPPAETCGNWHDIFGACELPRLHDGLHARVPGGATEPNTWTAEHAAGGAADGESDPAADEPPLIRLRRAHRFLTAALIRTEDAGEPVVEIGPMMVRHIADLLDRAAGEWMARAWGEGYAAAMARYVPGAVPIWRRDANPYRAAAGAATAGTRPAGHWLEEVAGGPPRLTPAAEEARPAACTCNAADLATYAGPDAVCAVHGEPELQDTDGYPRRTAHVVPSGDLIEHDLDERCACGTRAERVTRADGSDGWVIVHSSLDGREQREESAAHRFQPGMWTKRCTEIVGGRKNCGRLADDPIHTAAEEARTSPPAAVEVHKPFTDDGITYCGWDKHEGCGEVWPCAWERARRAAGGATREPDTAAFPPVWTGMPNPPAAAEGSPTTAAAADKPHAWVGCSETVCRLDLADDACHADIGDGMVCCLPYSDPIHQAAAEDTTAAPTHEYVNWDGFCHTCRQPRDAAVHRTPGPDERSGT